MVAVFEPAVLLAVAWLVALFVAGWRYRRGSMPPTRALLVVAAGLFWLAFSVTQLADFVELPNENMLVAVSALLLLAGATAAWRWWRTR